MKVLLKIETRKPLEISVCNDGHTTKGFFHPNNANKLFDLLQKIVLKGASTWEINNNTKLNWTVPSPGTLALDEENDSIIFKMPENIYYVPYVGNQNHVVFKLDLPNIIAIKKRLKHWFYWSDINFHDIDINSTVYPLEMPHLYQSGDLCIGNFKEELDFNNPSKYFIDLFTYPVAHNNQVDILREMEKNGYRKEFVKGRTIKSFI